MSAQPLEQHTYLPDADDQSAEVLSFMEAHKVQGGTVAPRYFLAGAQEHDHVEVPASVHKILLQILEAMAAGKAVTVAPQNKMLTTQQAADILGVSRPTVVKLIDEGVLPGETPGVRRRMIKLDDVLKYRAQRRERQYQALMADDVDYDEEPIAHERAEDAHRTARAEVAAARRAKRSAR